MVIEESILPLNDPRTFLSIDSTFMIYQLQGTTHTRNMLLLTYSEVLICYQQGLRIMGSNHINLFFVQYVQEIYFIQTVFTTPST